MTINETLNPSLTFGYLDILKLRQAGDRRVGRRLLPGCRHEVTQAWKRVGNTGMKRDQRA